MINYVTSLHIERVKLRGYKLLTVIKVHTLLHVRELPCFTGTTSCWTVYISITAQGLSRTDERHGSNCLHELLPIVDLEKEDNLIHSLFQD